MTMLVGTVALSKLLEKEDAIFFFVAVIKADLEVT